MSWDMETHEQIRAERAARRVKNESNESRLEDSVITKACFKHRCRERSKTGAKVVNLCSLRHVFVAEKTEERESFCSASHLELHSP